MKRFRSKRPWTAPLVVLVALILLTIPLSGCDQDHIDEFRSASAEAFGSGLQSIADGVINGLVEIYTPDADSEGG